jgi:Tfp pilus assembly protein PilX
MMKVRSHGKHEKSGGVLVVIMVIVLTLGILVIGMFKLQETGAVGVVYEEQSKQAFWIAEAGLQVALQRFGYQSAYRSNPVSFTNAYGTNGSYMVTIPNVDPVSLVDIGDGILVNGTNYTIEVVGTVQVGGLKTFNRRIRHEISAVPGSKYVIETVDGNTTFHSNTKVYGSLISFNGTVDSGNNATVVFTDYIFSDTVVGNGSYTQAEVPPLDPPTLTTSIYTDQIDTIFENSSAPNLSISSSTEGTTNHDANVTYTAALTVDSGATITTSGDLRFSQTTTFDGPVVINAGGDVIFDNSTDLPADSIIIAKGDVSLSSQTVLGSNVRIYSGGDFTIGAQANIDGGTIIYADEDLTVSSGGANTIDASGIGIVLLANESISINSNMEPFKGIMYANTGQIELNANMDIYGTVIGGIGFDAASNVDFYYDPSVFAWDLSSDTGIGINFNDALLVKGRWQELPPPM